MAIFLRILDRLEEALISVLMAAATLLIFVAIVQRSGLSNAAMVLAWAKSNDLPGIAGGAATVFGFLNSVNLTWAQELCIYLFVWMAKFGAAYGVRTGIHVGVDIALKLISEPSKHHIVLFGLCCGALFTFIIGTLGANFVWHIADTEQTSPDLELPIWIVYLAVPLGSYLMCFRFLQVAVVFGLTGGLPHHDLGHVAGVEEGETKAPAPASPALAKEA